MNKKHVSFPSIEQFRNIVAEVKAKATYIGRDENGDAMFDESLPKPTITFEGTVKLHGRNCGVNYFGGEIWAQSREDVFGIPTNPDSVGFARFVDSNDSFSKLFAEILNTVEVSDTEIITIFGEWCGKGTQSGVGIAQLEKSFFIFGAKISSIIPEVESYWIDHTYLRDKENRIYNINDYQKFSVTIDFENPSEQLDTLGEMALEVERQCPVSTEFGVEGIGEGVVFSAVWEGHNLRFKVKGDKHKVAKTKKIVDVDVEKLSSISEFVDYAVTENRLDQGISIVFKNDEPISMSKMGDIMKWMNLDIIKEESDTLKQNGLDFRDVGKQVSTRIKEMFIKKLDSAL